MNRARLVLFAAALVPVQAAGQAPPSAPSGAVPAAASVAPRQQPAGMVFRLQEPVTLHFAVDTNAGPIEGTVVVTDIVGRGLEGWGRFELSLRADPSTVRTGDRLRDRVIAEQVLQASKGSLLLTAYTRLAPPKAPPAEPGAAANVAALPVAVGALDEHRRKAPVEVAYSWEGDAEKGTLRLEHSATLEQLGLGAAAHPFVQLSGPVRLRLAAPLLRDR